MQKAQAFRASQAALAKDRNNIDLAVNLARQAIDEGRRNADPRFYGQAEAALAVWWDQPDPPPQVRVLRAVIRQAYHDFPAALADLNALLATDANDAQARMSRAFIRMVVGDVRGAESDCSQLPDAVGAVVREVCKARVAALSGAAAQGKERLVTAVQASPRTQDAMRRFAYAVLADISLSLGDAADAAQFFTAATNGGHADVSVLAAQADSLLDRNDPKAAQDLLDGKGDADVLLLRQAIAARRLGDSRLAEWSAILTERFDAAAAAAGNARVHLREEARFRLEVEGDAAKALELAQANWQVQREPADVRLLLEAALAAGDARAARPALDFIKETGLQDARLAPLLTRLSGAGG